MAAVVAAFTPATLAQLYSDLKTKAAALARAQAEMETAVAGIRTISTLVDPTSPPAISLGPLFDAYLSGDPAPVDGMTKQLLIQFASAIDNIRQTWDATGTVGAEAAFPKAYRTLINLVARSVQG